MTDHSFILPVLSMDETDNFAIECHKNFMSSFVKINTGGLAFRAYLSICQTAQQMITTPEHITRDLVNMGMRAEKSAFPANFVQYIEHHICHHSLEKHHLNLSQRNLFTFWQEPSIKIHLFGNPFTALPKKTSIQARPSIRLQR